MITSFKLQIKCEGVLGRWDTAPLFPTICTAQTWTFFFVSLRLFYLQFPLPTEEDSERARVPVWTDAFQHRRFSCSSRESTQVPSVSLLVTYTLFIT